MVIACAICSVISLYFILNNGEDKWFIPFIMSIIAILKLTI